MFRSGSGRDPLQSAFCVVDEMRDAGGTDPGCRN